MPKPATQSDEPAAERDAAQERVLDAALAEFTEFGIRRATIDSVAARASTGRTTVYRRFGDKDGLTRAVLTREADRFLETLRDSIEGQPTVEAALEETFAVAVLAFREHALLQRLIKREPQDALPYLTSAGALILEGSIAFQRAEVTLIPDVGEYDPRAVDSACEATVRLVHSYALTPPSNGKLDDRRLRAIARRMITPLLRG